MPSDRLARPACPVPARVQCGSRATGRGALHLPPVPLGAGRMEAAPCHLPWAILRIFPAHPFIPVASFARSPERMRGTGTVLGTGDPAVSETDRSWVHSARSTARVVGTHSEQRKVGVGDCQRVAPWPGGRKGEVRTDLGKPSGVLRGALAGRGQTGRTREASGALLGGGW